MFDCDVRLVCDGRAGHLLMNFAGMDERFPADVGVCIPCLRAAWRERRSMHRAVWWLLNRAAGTDLPFPGVPMKGVAS